MFYFLPESKRTKIVYHSALSPLLSRNDTKGFLSNLGAFSGELGITQEEIKRIEKYLVALNSPTFKQLSEKIFREAGFEVFHWAGGRDDLNDWLPMAGCYIKAVHNFIGYTKYKELQEQAKISNGIIQSGAPYSLILREPLRENAQLSVEIPSGSHIEQIRDPEWGMSSKVPNSETRTIHFDVHPELRQVQEYPNHIKAWGCAYVEYEQTQQKVSETPKVVEVPDDRWRGKFGYKKKIKVIEPVYQTVLVRKRGHLIFADQIVGNAGKEIPYFIQLCVQKAVPDFLKRVAVGPQIYLICGKNLADELIFFLLQNPDNYIDLLMGFIKKEMFPNVNKGILSPPFFPTKGIVFENYTNGQKITIP